MMVDCPRMLVTGNPQKNIAKSIADLYPSMHTVSRSACSTYHIDLSVDSGINELAKLSTGYDVFVNCALIPNFGQTRILQAVWTEWKSVGHGGHIISFGSSVDYYHRPDNRLYPVEKRALRDLNMSLSKHACWHDSKIRCTYFSFGGVSTEKTVEQWGHYQHFDPSEIASYLRWLIQSPPNANVDELHVTPVQPMRKSEMKKNDKGNPIAWTSGDTRTYLISEE